MRIMGAVAGVVTGVAALGVCAAMAGGVSASAGSVPVVYRAAGPAAVRPPSFYIARSPAGGSGWFMTGLRWSRWDAVSAAGRGREYDSVSYARLTLSRVEVHGGRRYYSRLAVAAPRGFTSGRLRWSWAAHEWVQSAGSVAVVAESQVPVVYSGMGGRWVSAAVRPRYMAMGAGYWYDRLRWSGWTGRTAHGQGRIDYSNNGEAGPVHRYPVKITFSNVLVHAGRRYFARMTVRSPDHMAGRPGHAPTTLHLWMSRGQWTWT
jgi:hypothetical protein